MTKISVVISTYNHEKYIEQCLVSVLEQRGDFQIEIIVGDDCSTDTTREIIEDFRTKRSKEIILLPREKNLGITKNLKRCLDACSGDYISICEGDDYWSDSYKLQKQMAFLDQHADYSMCFSAFVIYLENTGAYNIFSDPFNLKNEFITVEELIEHNYIGNFSCCMYRRDVIQRLPQKLFEIFTVDWMFNMACGELGKIGFIPDWMSVYRKHEKGAWTGQPELENLEKILLLIDLYNEYFEYKYDKQFAKKKERIQESIAYLQATINRDIDKKTFMTLNQQIAGKGRERGITSQILLNEVAQKEMYDPKFLVTDLFQDIKKIVSGIDVDLGGGCPLSKSFLMAYIALEYNLEEYVEIGVYRGRSFFPMAFATRLLGGKAYGIDAYDSEIAREYDLDGDFGTQVNDFLAKLDFSRIYEDVLRLQQELGVVQSSEVLKEKSKVAVDFFREKKISIDMLHIDGNHDTRQVNEDVDLYLPLVRQGGVVVLDDINWESVRPVFNRLKENYEVIFNNGQFAILHIETSPKRITADQIHRFNNLHSIVENIERTSTPDNEFIQSHWNNPKISVVVISYNQEKYIAECLEGIFAQTGAFTIELVIGDDGSTDATLEIVDKYIYNFKTSRIQVKILAADGNIGMTRNFQRCLNACTGEYIAICEGDDYWIDRNKLQKQVDFLKSHTECALCFHHIYIKNQESGLLSTLESQELLEANVISTKDLILTYFIGNLSCCLYDARHMQSIPKELFDLYIGDWMFNIFYSQFGDIGHIRDYMSVYRKHSEGVWSGKESSAQLIQLSAYIDEYNKFLNFEYDAEFTAKQIELEVSHPDKFNTDELEIAVIDTTFPHPLSAFRMQEFDSYLKEFNNLKIYSSGLSVRILGTESLEDLFAQYKRAHPEYATRVSIIQFHTVINTKLVYMVFLGTAYQYIDVIERADVPFVFTLYPGGLFGINNAKSDMMLKRVTSSAGFRKVIVTQKNTYDYLIKKGFCRPDQIEFIFGVVTPLEQIEAEYTGKFHFGIDKNTLDICFAAHKYTEKGTDKGYDVFIDVAKDLCKKFDNIRFHVVGGFDENVIDVSDIKERITFYGRRDIQWFDEFYRDKDIILSPNVPFMIFEGSFDGFPTGTCVDAGLRKTAIFCTDELSLNTHFKDGDEIVIIPHHAGQIVEIIQKYYNNPEMLKAVAESGCRRIKKIYCFEAQIQPRIDILKKELGQARSAKRIIFKNQSMSAKKIVYKSQPKLSFRQRVEQRIIRFLMTAKRLSPSWMKSLFKKADRQIRSNPALFGFIKRHSPEFIIRAYLKLTGYL